MNKKILAFSLGFSILTVLPQVSSAQQTLYIGVKGGLSIPNLSAGGGKNVNDWNKDYKSIERALYGISIEYKFSKHISLKLEGDYIGEGGKRTGIQPMSIPTEYLQMFQHAFSTDKNYLYGDLNNTSHLDYIQIPLMAKGEFAVSKNKRLKFYMQVGPFVSFLFKANQIVTSQEMNFYVDAGAQDEIPPVAAKAVMGDHIDTVIDAMPDLNKTNVGVQGGVGFSYDLGPGKVFIEGGGNYGFIAVQKGDEHGKDFIGAGTVSIGYAFKVWAKEDDKKD